MAAPRNLTSIPRFCLDKTMLCSRRSKVGVPSIRTSTQHLTLYSSADAASATVATKGILCCKGSRRFAAAQTDEKLSFGAPGFGPTGLSLPLRLLLLLLRRWLLWLLLLPLRRLVCLLQIRLCTDRALAKILPKSTIIYFGTAHDPLIGHVARPAALHALAMAPSEKLCMSVSCTRCTSSIGACKLSLQGLTACFTDNASSISSYMMKKLDDSTLI